MNSLRTPVPFQAVALVAGPTAFLLGFLGSSWDFILLLLTGGRGRQTTWGLDGALLANVLRPWCGKGPYTPMISSLTVSLRSSHHAKHSVHPFPSSASGEQYNQVIEHPICYLGNVRALPLVHPAHDQLGMLRCDKHPRIHNLR